MKQINLKDIALICNRQRERGEDSERERKEEHVEHIDGLANATLALCSEPLKYEIALNEWDHITHMHKHIISKSLCRIHKAHKETQAVQTALRVALTGRCCNVQPCTCLFSFNLCGEKDLCELLLKV